MARRDELNVWRVRSRALLVAVVVFGAGGIGSVGTASAAVTAVRGSACGYIANVGLFGGPLDLRGCGQPSSAPAESASPSVSLPAGGSSTLLTASDEDGATAQYGPAVLFGGRWPDELDAPPPSGPIRASTQGTPAGGSVSSSAHIGAPRGTGPLTVEADEVHVECTASETGVTGSTRLVNALLATSTDPEGAPVDQEPVPDNPAVNYTRTGVITNVGDNFRVVYNEHIVNDDGSLTVNGAHMYLLGPTAVGEVIRGQATCGVTSSSSSPSSSDTAPLAAASAGTQDTSGGGGRSGGAGTSGTTTTIRSTSGSTTTVAAGRGGSTTTVASATRGMAQTGTDPLAFVLLADAAAVAGLILLIVGRRRRAEEDEEALPYVRR